MIYISNRKETKNELDLLYNELFNNNASKIKIKKFKELCEQAYKFVPSERCKDKKCVLGPQCGNLDSEIMFIAEAPGRNGAERTGIPIYGDPTGDNFEIILNKATYGVLSRKDVYITNTFLWNPTSEKGNNDKPTEEEINKSFFLLREQIGIVKPKLIITLGKTAFDTLNKYQNLSIKNYIFKYTVGNLYPLMNDISIGVMYHPSPRVIGIHRSIDQMVLDLRKMIRNYIDQTQK